MHDLELILILLAAAAALEWLAHKINVPHPALLVLGGLGLALVPGLPRIEVDPESVFLIFIRRSCTAPPSRRRGATSARTSPRS